MPKLKCLQLLLGFRASNFLAFSISFCVLYAPNLASPCNRCSFQVLDKSLSATPDDE